jgi:choline dehydrogenase
MVKATLGEYSDAGYPVTDNVSAPVKDGASAADMNVKDGRRYSVAQAYLLPVLERPNLTVATDTSVESLLFDGARCVGVRCRIDGADADIRSMHDVVLSAGSMESPRLLMLSGIGDAAHLRKLGIPVRVDLQSVGENLHDHCLLRTFAAQTETTSSPRIDAQLVVRSRAGMSVPDLHIALTQPANIPPDAIKGVGFTLLAGLLRPQSRGKLMLTSVDRGQLDHAGNHDGSYARADNRDRGTGGANDCRERALRNARCNSPGRPFTYLASQCLVSSF